MKTLYVLAGHRHKEVGIDWLENNVCTGDPVVVVTVSTLNSGHKIDIGSK